MQESSYAYPRSMDEGKLIELYLIHIYRRQEQTISPTSLTKLLPEARS